MVKLSTISATLAFAAILFGVPVKSLTPSKSEGVICSYFKDAHNHGIPLNICHTQYGGAPSSSTSYKFVCSPDQQNILRYDYIGMDCGGELIHSQKQLVNNGFECNGNSCPFYERFECSGAAGCPKDEKDINYRCECPNWSTKYYLMQNFDDIHCIGKDKGNDQCTAGNFVINTCNDKLKNEINNGCYPSTTKKPSWHSTSVKPTTKRPSWKTTTKKATPKPTWKTTTKKPTWKTTKKPTWKTTKQPTTPQPTTTTKKPTWKTTTKKPTWTTTKEPTTTTAKPTWTTTKQPTTPTPTTTTAKPTTTQPPTTAKPTWTTTKQQTTPRPTTPNPTTTTKKPSWKTTKPPTTTTKKPSWTTKKPTPSWTTRKPTPRPSWTTKKPTPRPSRKTTRRPTPRPSWTTKRPTPRPSWKTTRRPTPRPSWKTTKRPNWKTTKNWKRTSKRFGSWNSWEQRRNKWEQDRSDRWDDW